MMKKFKTIVKSTLYVTISTLMMAPSYGADNNNISYNFENLSLAEKKIAVEIEQNFEDQVKFLEKTVNINSGSKHIEGVRAVGKVFAEEFNQIGFKSHWIDMPKKMLRAGHFVSEIKGSKGKKLLILGHLDTVFPKNSPFQKFIRNGRYASGPGVADMKGGDAIILYALKALKAQGHLEDRQITVFFTGDEESTGKPLSIARKELIEIAKKSDAALNFEGGSDNVGVVARRGSAGWTLKVKARAAHSSGIFTDGSGVGAINEAARILSGFYSEVRGERYLTFNPGIILGGTTAEHDSKTSSGTAYGKSNIIAQTAIVHGDLRFISEKQLKRVQDKMRHIVKGSLPQTSAKITFNVSYSPMPETAGNNELFDLLETVNKDLGHGMMVKHDPGKRGAADISFVAPYVASIDGLGAWGGGSHTIREKIDLEALKFLTIRTAVYIHRLTDSKK